MLGPDLYFPPYVLGCFAFHSYPIMISFVFFITPNILSNFMQNFSHVTRGVNTMQICGLCWGV